MTCCLNCGEKDVHFHCMVDGNDYDFCSETCIQEYSFVKSARIVVIEEFDLGLKEKVIFT